MKIKVNENFGKIKQNYLFSEIASRVRAFKEANPEASIIKMGIGDVTLPIAPVVIEAMKKGGGAMGGPRGNRPAPPAKPTLEEEITNNTRLYVVVYD